ncbi:MAG: magnesium transporter CorA family protein [Anaerolineae bacterium]|nr:magnesium transporter CorA family protein [Anaerolineae bacterium]
MQILKNNPEGVIETLYEFVEGAWVHLSNPTLDELQHISKELNIAPDLLHPPLDEDELARVEKDGLNTLIILRIPHYQGETHDIPYTTIPLGIIMTPRHLVSVCKVDHIILQEFCRGHKLGLSTSKKNRFLLLLLQRTATEYLTNLRAINRAVDKLEDRLQVSQGNREVLDLLKYQKSLVYFTTALRSNELMMERLHRIGLFHQYPADEELLEDVLIEIRQAIEMVNISNNILSQMMDAFASIISNNLNVVMKLLALATIVLSLPTLVASIFGMNVNLPFEDSPYAFAVTMGLSLILCIIVVVVFRRRGFI